MKTLRLGTRGSDLALAQTRLVATKLRTAYSNFVVEEKIIHTSGDTRLDINSDRPEHLDKGLFTKELEESLLRGEIDAAIHSLKDLPTEFPPGLTLGAILIREDPHDILISKVPGDFSSLPRGACIGTSSLRRQHFLSCERPDLKIYKIRGNVPTRIRKLMESDQLSSIVIAKAGLNRLQNAKCALPLDRVHISPLDFMLPAPGQGAIAVECRIADLDMLSILSLLHHSETAMCVTAERMILSKLGGGGCHLPLGVLAKICGDNMELKAAWFSENFIAPRKASQCAPLSNWHAMAEDVANQLLNFDYE